MLTIKRRPPLDVAHLPDAIPHKLKLIYASRGIDCAEQLERSLKKLQHFAQMHQLDKAVAILIEAIQTQQKIIVVGDFDADGATSTALCMLALDALGSRNHSYLVPNRFDFGYGLSPQIVDVAAQQQADVIMTVDSGIACFAGVERAKQLGLKVLVTDHHLAAERLPDADAIVNPNQPNCEFPSKHLAGVGVAFYLMLALRSELVKRGWFEQTGKSAPNLASWLDIVALGTVADVVPLDDNNRILVHQGLQRIRSGQCRPGIKAIVEVAGRQLSRLNASDMGFVVGPRLNAAGRLDDMALGIECLLAKDEAIARRIAAQLDGLNQERRDIEKSMQAEAEQALEQLEFDQQSLPAGLVLYKEDYHQGVIGILAGRIKDKFYRPTIAFAHQDEDNLKGSARSIQGLHIRDLLEEINHRYPDLLGKFGGHAMAAGLSLPAHNLDAFKSVFAATANEWLQGKSLSDEYLSDGELSAPELTLDFAQLLQQSGPWGQGFEEPLFDGEFELVSQRIVGQNHLKMVIKCKDGPVLDAIAFNVDTQKWPNQQAHQVQLVYKLSINEFRGNTNVQLMVEGLAAL